MSWDGKSKAGLGGYKMFVYCLRLFGINAAYTLVKIASFYYVIFHRTTFQYIYHYFRKRFNYSPIKAFLKTWDNHHIFGTTLIDKTVLFAGMKNRLTFEFDGEENLKKIKEDKKGGILVSAHMGNWDIAGNFLNSRIQSEINVVMFDQEHQQIKKYFEALHKNKQMNIIPIKDDMSHIFGINHALNNNELICIHGDRFLEGSKTMTRNFLGEEARFPAGPFAIASKFEVPVVFVYALKENRNHYHLYCSAPKVYKNKQEEMMDDYVANLERMTKKYPEQWFNYFDFWKKKLNMTSEKDNILQLIPQRPPFVMVDRILFSERGKTLTSFYIKENNIFSENGFFREPGMIENMAQTVAAGRGYEGAKDNETPKIGYIGSVKNLKIYFFPKVNTEIKTEITVLNQVLHFTSVSGKILSEGEIAAECEIVISA